MIAKYGQSILPQLETVDMSAIIDEANTAQKLGTARKGIYTQECPQQDTKTSLVCICYGSLHIKCKSGHMILLRP